MKVFENHWKKRPDFLGDFSNSTFMVFFSTKKNLGWTSGGRPNGQISTKQKGFH